jgi:hypothetical protein
VNHHLVEDYITQVHNVIHAVAQTGGCGKDHDKEKSLTRQVKNFKSPLTCLMRKR